MSYTRVNSLDRSFHHAQAARRWWAGKTPEERSAIMSRIRREGKKERPKRGSYKLDRIAQMDRVISS